MASKKPMPAAEQETKEMPSAAPDVKEKPAAEVKPRDLPQVGVPENTVIIGGKLIEIKPVL